MKLIIESSLTYVIFFQEFSIDFSLYRTCSSIDFSLSVFIQNFVIEDIAYDKSYRLLANWNLKI